MHCRKAKSEQISCVSCVESVQCGTEEGSELNRTIVFVFFLHTFQIAFYITTGHLYWFTTLFCTFSDFFFALQFSDFSFSLLPFFFFFVAFTWKASGMKKAKKKKISWWWNINRSKKFNYINSLFLDFSVNYFLWFFQFHFSFRINFESWKFVCKITFEKPRRRSGRGQGKMENINSKEVLIWYRSVALYMCALRLLCNVKCGTGAIWRWLEGWCGGGERSFSRGGQMMGFMYVFLFYFGCLHKCEFHRCVRRRVCVCDFP